MHTSFCIARDITSLYSQAWHARSRSTDFTSILDKDMHLGHAHPLHPRSGSRSFVVAPKSRYSLQPIERPPTLKRIEFPTHLVKHLTPVISILLLYHVGSSYFQWSSERKSFCNAANGSYRCHIPHATVSCAVGFWSTHPRILFDLLECLLGLWCINTSVVNTAPVLVIAVEYQRGDAFIEEEWPKIYRSTKSHSIGIGTTWSELWFIEIYGYDDCFETTLIFFGSLLVLH